MRTRKGAPGEAGASPHAGLATEAMVSMTGLLLDGIPSLQHGREGGALGDPQERKPSESAVQSRQRQDWVLRAASHCWVL